MATIEVSADLAVVRVRDKPMARLVRLLASPDAKGRPRAAWIPSDRAAKALGMKPVALASAIRRGVESEMVVTATRANGRVWLRISPVAGAILGVAVPDEGPPVDGSPFSGDPHEAAVMLLAGEGSTCPCVEAMADRHGLDVEEVWASLASAEAAGLAECWEDHPMGPAASLSPLAAGRLGLVPSADGMRWLRPGDPDPTTIDPRVPELSETDASNPDGESRRFDELADPGSPDGLAVLVGAEEDAPRWGRVAEDVAAEAGLEKAMAPGWREDHDYREHRGIPRVRLLIGIGMTWPVMAPGVAPARPWTPGDGPCPACRGARLGLAAVCLVCCNAGCAHLLPPPIAVGPGPKMRGFQGPVRRREVAAARREVALRGGL